MAPIRGCITRERENSGVLHGSVPCAETRRKGGDRVKSRKVIVTKEVWTSLNIREIRNWELSNTMHSDYQVKQVQVNVVKEGGKK